MLCEGSARVEGSQHVHRRKRKSAKRGSRGLSLNDPPQPAVPAPFYVNHLYTKKALEGMCLCAATHVSQQSLKSE